MNPNFYNELSSLLNKYNKEGGSNTPDYILANCLINCLKNFDSITKQREIFYGRLTKREDNINTILNEGDN